MFVVTGCQVMDGDPNVWVVDVVNTVEEAAVSIEAAEESYLRDYGEPVEDAGVLFDWCFISGTVQR